MDNDLDKMKMLVSFLRLVLLKNPNELNDCLQLFLSGSFPKNSNKILAQTVLSSSTKGRQQILTDANKTSFAQVVKDIKGSMKQTQLFSMKRQTIYVTEVSQCLEQVKKLPTSDYNAKANLTSPIFKRCDSNEAVAFMHSLQGNFTPFNRKNIFEALAKAYTIIHSSGYGKKKKSKFYRWVYTNIVVTFEAHRDLQHVCDTLIKDGVNDFPF